MPSPFDRRGHLVPEEAWETAREEERAKRIARFSRGADAPATRSRDVIPLAMEEEEYEPPSTRSHDPHTLEALRANLVEAMNSRG